LFFSELCIYYGAIVVPPFTRAQCRVFQSGMFTRFRCGRFCCHATTRTSSRRLAPSAVGACPSRSYLLCFVLFLIAFSIPVAAQQKEPGKGKTGGTVKGGKDLVGVFHNVNVWVCSNGQ
jgi:hypothetical protein